MDTTTLLGLAASIKSFDASSFVALTELPKAEQVVLALVLAGCGADLDKAAFETYRMGKVFEHLAELVREQRETETR